MTLRAVADVGDVSQLRSWLEHHPEGTEQEVSAALGVVLCNITRLQDWEACLDALLNDSRAHPNATCFACKGCGFSRTPLQLALLNEDLLEQDVAKYERIARKLLSLPTTDINAVNEEGLTVFQLLSKRNIPLATRLLHSRMSQVTATTAP